MWVMAEVVEGGEEFRGDREDGVNSGLSVAQRRLELEGGFSGKSRRCCGGARAVVTLSLFFLSCWRPIRQGGARRDEMR